MAWAAALVLMGLVLILALAARWALRSRYGAAADARLQLETRGSRRCTGGGRGQGRVDPLSRPHRDGRDRPVRGGKTTFLRCLNRMHELSEGGWITGKVLLHGRTSTTPASMPSSCGVASAWCSSGPRRSRRCRFTTMWPPGYG